MFYIFFIKFFLYFSDRFQDLCYGKVPRNEITMMKDISRIKDGYKGEHLFGKAQDILWDEEFYEYARYPKVLLIYRLNYYYLH